MGLCLAACICTHKGDGIEKGMCDEFIKEKNKHGINLIMSCYALS